MITTIIMTTIVVVISSSSSSSSSSVVVVVVVIDLSERQQGLEMISVHVGSIWIHGSYLMSHLLFIHDDNWQYM